MRDHGSGLPGRRGVRPLEGIMMHILSICQDNLVGSSFEDGLSLKFLRLFHVLYKIRQRTNNSITASIEHMSINLSSP